MEEQVIVKMMVNRGDTSPKVEVLVNRGNTFPTMIVQHHRDCQISRIPPEDQVPRGCSLHSMEPLREWFCRGADMTSVAEYEAALCQLEDDPLDIRQYNVNIREERWTNFSL